MASFCGLISLVSRYQTDFARRRCPAALAGRWQGAFLHRTPRKIDVGHRGARIASQNRHPKKAIRHGTCTRPHRQSVCGTEDGLKFLVLEPRHKRDVHPDDLESARSERRSGLACGVPFEIEKRMRGKDGQYRWFLFRYNPLLNEQGRVARWFATATDIEDRKQT
jgi:PAS fold